MVLHGQRYPFYITIATLMIMLVVLLSGLFLWISHRESREAAMSTADRVFAEINAKIIDKYEGQLQAVAVLTEEVASIQGMAILSKDRETIQPGLELLFSALALHPFLFSVYIGSDNGDFLQILAIREQSTQHDLFSAPPGTFYALRAIFTDNEGVRQEHWRFFNRDRQLISEEMTLGPKFDPRNRSWYVRAFQDESTFFTEPYLFYATTVPGITCARRLPNGVFAVDVTLERLAMELQSQRVSDNGYLFLFDSLGRIIVHPHMQPVSQDEQEGLKFLTAKEATDPVIRAIVAHALANPGDLHHQIRKIDVNGIEYLIRAAPIKEALHSDQVVLAVAPLSDFTGDIRKMWARILIFSGLVLLLMIPLVLYMARRISQPLIRLEQESLKIQRSDFSESPAFDSSIKEIHSLIQAFTLMKSTIRDYTDWLIQARQEIETLFSSIITLLAGAIDAKSPYTGAHCQRVPILARMLATAADASMDAPFANFKMDTDEKRREFEVAAWLHDCGKITTPEFVVDKATKLETIRNRIHEIRMRFEVLLRDAQIDFLQRRLAGDQEEARLLEELDVTQRQIVEDFAFVAECNIGGEFLDDDKIERLERIASRTWLRNLDDRLGISRDEASAKNRQKAPTLPVLEPVLADKPEHVVPRTTPDPFNSSRHGFTMAVPKNLWNLGELYNLKIRRGTLNQEERFKINEHIIQTIIMLRQLPFPENMKNVVDIAGSHHETLVGTGYPRGLQKEEMSIPARIMAIADIFEALTASDRPYKVAKPLSEVFKIMSRMRDDQHFDAELFELFLTSGVWKDYARDYLRPDQNDVMDIQPFLHRPAPTVH